MSLKEQLDNSMPYVGKTAQRDWPPCMLIERIITLISFLPPEERMDIFYGCNGMFCADCGETLEDKPCPCWTKD